MMRKQVMKKSNDLLSLSEVCEYFGLSEATIRRKVRESRENGGGFPLPIFKANSSLRWRRDSIENWQGEEAEGSSSVEVYRPLKKIKDDDT
jgi:predicted DNA-binding transcriptional regulator AlpA